MKKNYRIPSPPPPFIFEGGVIFKGYFRVYFKSNLSWLTEYYEVHLTFFFFLYCVETLKRTVHGSTFFLLFSSSKKKHCKKKKKKQSTLSTDPALAGELSTTKKSKKKKNKKKYPKIKNERGALYCELLLSSLFRSDIQQSLCVSPSQLRGDIKYRISIRNVPRLGASHLV